MDPKLVFTEQQIAEFERLFDRFDRDNDGHLTYRDADILLRAIGLDLSRDASDMFLMGADDEFSLSLSWDEFLDAAATAAAGPDAEDTAAHQAVQPAQLPDDAFDIPIEDEDKTELTAFGAPTNEKLYRAFQLVDADGDGAISDRELEAMLLRMGERPSPDQLAELMRQVDSDGDGKIGFVEFSKYYYRQ